MSSRFGTAIPASRSTARSSSVVGFNRSIQTVLSGNSAGSAAGSFFRAESEGTNTENMGNSGTRQQSVVLPRSHDANRYHFARTSYQHPAVLPRFWQALHDGALARRPNMWPRGGVGAAEVRPRRTRCLKINRKSQNLRHKSHSRASATRNKRANAGVGGGFCQ